MKRIITGTGVFRLLLAALLLLPGCAGGEPHSGGAHEDHEPGGAPGGHVGDHGPKLVQLSPAQMQEFGVEVAVAGSGELHVDAVLPGVVQVNPDGLVHITPRVPGVVGSVFKALGEDVAAGELLAVLESRELAEAKADFLAARERLELAAGNRQREQRLHERRISSEQEYLEARQAEAQQQIALRSAEQRLHALGLDEADVARLHEQPDESLTRYEMRAPTDGTVVDKHITRGEMLRADSLPFVIADLSTVWVVLTVYQKDLAAIRPGQAVRVTASHELARAEGAIDYVSPILDEHTRTTTARVVLDNDAGRWRPGLFVTGHVVVERVTGDVVVPKSAVQSLDEQSVIFVETTDGYEARPVQLGAADDRSVIVATGLRSGQRYVARGGFALKAELTKGSFAHAGHAH